MRRGFIASIERMKELAFIQTDEPPEGAWLAELSEEDYDAYAATCAAFETWQVVLAHRFIPEVHAKWEDVKRRRSERPETVTPPAGE